MIDVSVIERKGCAMQTRRFPTTCTCRCCDEQEQMCWLHQWRTAILW